MSKEEKKKNNSGQPHPLDAVYQDEELRSLARPIVRIWSMGTVIFLIIAGLVGGIAGSMVGPRFLPQMYPAANTNSSSGISNSALQEKVTPQNQLDRVSAAVVRVVELPKDDAVFGTSKGLGMVLTVDGWAVTPDSTSVNLGAAPIAVFLDGKSYPIDDVFSDKTTGMTFFHLKVDRALPVIRFARTVPRPGDDVWQVRLHSSQQVLDVHKTILSAARIVSGEGDRNLFQTTTKSSLRYLLGDVLASRDNGAAVVDTFGDVVGIVRSDGDATSVLPISFVQQFLEDALHKKEATRATLGVTYLDLALSPLINSKTSSGLKTGALLASGGRDLAAVESEGPAEKAGLHAGDVITQVDGQLLSSALSLVEVIWQYRPGQSLDIVYMRGGQEKRATIVLGEKQ